MEVNSCHSSNRLNMTFVRQHIHGIIGAAIFAAAVIVLLLLLGFTTALPLPLEEGILIDFGGGGNENAGESSSATSNEQNASTQNSSNTGVNTQSFEDAVSMQSSDVPNPNNNTTDSNSETNTETETSSQPTVNSNLANIVNGGMFGNGNGSGNSGDGTGGGNPGTGGDGSNGSGSGPGGYGGSLDGRKQIKTVDPENQDNLEGRVVLKITVNDQGNVTNISLVSSNCDKCVQLAKAAVWQWKYEKKAGAGYQTGTVAIEFRL